MDMIIKSGHFEDFIFSKYRLKFLKAQFKAFIFILDPQKFRSRRENVKTWLFDKQKLDYSTYVDHRTTFIKSLLESTQFEILVGSYMDSIEKRILNQRNLGWVVNYSTAVDFSVAKL